MEVNSNGSEITNFLILFEIKKMPTLSYVISSALFIFPFVAAGILMETVEGYNYGQWFAAMLCGVSALVILRILNKEVTISSLIEGARLLRLGKKGVTLDPSESKYSFFRIFAAILNFPGYVFSFLFFPNSEFGYYAGVITMFVSRLRVYDKVF